MVVDGIRKFIEDNGISIAEAAEAAGMAEQDMRDALAGEKPMPLERGYSLCRHYGASIGEILGEHEGL